MVTSGAALVKDVLGGQVRKAVTFLLTYLVAIGIALAMRASDFADAVSLGGGKTLENVNTATILLVGFALLSLARVYYETKKALDGSDTAVETKLAIADPPPSP